MLFTATVRLCLDSYIYRRCVVRLGPQITSTPEWQRYSRGDIGARGRRRRTRLALTARRTARDTPVSLLLSLLLNRASMSGLTELAAAVRHAGGHDPDDPCATHDHAMVFHSCVCAEILFKGWNTTNELQLFGSCVAIFVAAVLYEGFKYWRETLTAPAEPTACDKREPAAPRSLRALLCSGAHCVQTALHALQSTLSYLLMLVFMTYNIWLCLAVVLGLTLGYFLFGWRRSSLQDANDHCQ
ncbi:hypothetical protein PYW07_016276 [Mythimna separata]|uniref:Copper transport protein n=1 Tax=Mythimna separata TaxID=271217 RepID=A0AAD7YRL9_MYTSE|nr:hypothetical protein PYW07_016276 [Mythimna separata]